MTLVLNAAPTPSFLGHSDTINPDSKLPLSSFSLRSNHLTTTCCAFSLLFRRAKMTKSLSTASLRGALNASAGKVAICSTSASTASASSPAHPYARFTLPGGGRHRSIHIASKIAGTLQRGQLQSSALDTGSPISRCDTNGDFNSTEAGVRARKWDLKLDGVFIAGTKRAAVGFTDENGGEGVEGVDSLYVSPGEWCSRWCLGRVKWWRG